MISLPVVERELRVLARKPRTYNGRLLWGLAAVGLIWFIALDNPGKFTQGEYALTVIHATLATFLVIMAPITAADSISRERREGTFPLLFLTPLTARQIILGKFSSRLLRLFYLWLLMAPLMILPALIGGVSGEQFFVSIGILLSVILIGVSAGIVVSSLCASFAFAVICSIFFGAIAIFSLANLVTNLPIWIFRPNAGFGVPTSNLVFLAPLSIIFPTQVMEFYRMFFITRHLPLFIALGLVVVGILFLFCSVQFCSWRISKFAVGTGETARQASLRRKFLTPIFWKRAFRRSMRRKLRDNPFLWLEYRTAWSRAVRLGAIAFVVAFETVLVIGDPVLGYFVDAQYLLLWGVVIAMVLKSATSFHFEKENGAFEQILVTPLTEARLVRGRVRAVHEYFWLLKVSLLLFTLIGWLWLKAGLRIWDADSAMEAVNPWLCLLSIPAVGLFFALRCKSFFAALGWTVTFSVFGAPLLWGSISGTLWFGAHWFNSEVLNYLDSAAKEWIWPPITLALVYQVLLIATAPRLTVRLLKRRSFV